MFSLLGPRRFRRTFNWPICITQRPSQTNPWRSAQGVVTTNSTTPQESS
jgi:hypothetical protein